jgi:hypothetical protein
LFVSWLVRFYFLPVLLLSLSLLFHPPFFSLSLPPPNVPVPFQQRRDLVGRSAKHDHLKQLRRMARSGLSHLFLLLEQDLNQADKETAWGAGPVEGTAANVV